MTITAEAVKTLRERTGAGMMECKKALQETGGDLDTAAELMRKQGLAKADKKAARVAAEGIIAIERSADGKLAAIVEVNCETDFVAREKDFQAFVTNVAKLALAEHAKSTVSVGLRGLSPTYIGIEALAALKLDGGTVDDVRRALVAKIGEKIDIRRVAVLEAPAVVGTYLHGTRIGVLVGLTKGSEAVARDVAMHVAALNPARLSPKDFPAAEIAKEREIQAEQLKNDPKNAGKPEAMLARIVDGKLQKWFSEVTLLGQPFVKDDKQSVEQYLKTSGAEASGYVRFEVGAGIEKKQGDFAAEVMATVQSVTDPKGPADKPPAH